MFLINPFIFGKNWQLQTGNLVYMTSNNAPSPYVATTSATPNLGSAFNTFDNSSSSETRIDYGSGVFWAKMMWTTPIRIVQGIARVHRSGQTSTAFRVYAIKEDLSEVLIYSGTHTSDTDITYTSTDQNTEFIGIRLEIDRRADLIVSTRNCRITQWYEMV